MVAPSSPPPFRPRVGMLGGGFMARVHSHAARAAGADLVALASSTPESSARAAAQLGYAKALDADGVIATRPDIVHVCSPNALHATQAGAALAAGVHVICEKPLATSALAARGLADLAEEHERVATVPFVYRYHPMVREARARMRAGEFGTVLTVQGSYLQDWLLSASDTNWRVDSAVGGASRAFADIGSHLVDLLEFITGDRITRLVATTRTVHGRRDGGPVTTEDCAAVTCEFTSAAIGTLLVSQVAPGRKNALVLEIAAERSSLRFEQESPEQLWIGRRRGSELLDREVQALHPEAARLSRLPAGHAQGYQDAFNAFVADSYALIAGEERDGVPTFADGVRAAVVTDAVLESARTGGWVKV